MGPKWSKTFRLTILVPFGPFWTTLECWQACHVWPFLVQNGPFLDHPQSWTIDPRVKKGSSSCLLCVACLWNPKYSLLEHKYGRNQWKMSKIGQNSMKKWPFFAIILPWMTRCGSERSFCNSSEFSYKTINVQLCLGYYWGDDGVEISIKCLIGG